MTNIDPTAQMSAEQKLIQEKVGVLKKARDLQVQLAKARAELTEIDLRLVNGGFKISDIIVACW